MSLTPNSLYIALFIRNDPPPPNDYHWALYLHHPSSSSSSSSSPKTTGSGTKYHITNSAASNNSWVASHGPESGILKSFLLVGLVRIGHIQIQVEAQGQGDDAAAAEEAAAANIREKVDKLLRTYDGRLNEMGVTCRTWVWRVLDVLRREGVVSGGGGGTGLRDGDGEGNWQELESEVFDFGNAVRMEAAANVQPRPVFEAVALLSIQ